MEYTKGDGMGNRNYWFSSFLSASVAFAPKIFRFVSHFDFRFHSHFPFMARVLVSMSIWMITYKMPEANTQHWLRPILFFREIILCKSYFCICMCVIAHSHSIYDKSWKRICPRCKRTEKEEERGSWIHEYFVTKNVSNGEMNYCGQHDKSVRVEHSWQLTTISVLYHYRNLIVHWLTWPGFYSIRIFS